MEVYSDAPNRNTRVYKLFVPESDKDGHKLLYNVKLTCGKHMCLSGIVYQDKYLLISISSV